MTFGEKIKQERKKHGWSQDQLAKKIGIHGRHVGKYETERAMPNGETLIKIADALDTSIDYLLRSDFDNNTTSSIPIHDQSLLRKFLALEKMTEDDKHIIISLIDAFIKKQKIEQVIQQ